MKPLEKVKVVEIAESVLVRYFNDLMHDADLPYPTVLGSLHQSGLDFEASKLYEHITKTTNCTVPFIMDISESEMIRLFTSEDDNIRVSALLSVIDMRLPQLQLRYRV